MKEGCICTSGREYSKCYMKALRNSLMNKRMQQESLRLYNFNIQTD